MVLLPCMMKLTTFSQLVGANWPNSYLRTKTSIATPSQLKWLGNWRTSPDDEHAFQSKWMKLRWSGSSWRSHQTRYITTCSKGPPSKQHLSLKRSSCPTASRKTSHPVAWTCLRVMIARLSFKHQLCFKIWGRCFLTKCRYWWRNKIERICWSSIEKCKGHV